MATNRYGLKEWDIYRQGEAAKFQAEVEKSTQVWDEWDAAAVTSETPPPTPEIEHPSELKPPEVPEIPLAFDSSLMGEEGGDHKATMELLEKETSATLKRLKEIRRPLEQDWKDNMSYYEMAEELKDRNYRQSDIELISALDRDAELSPERMAMLLPIIYEAVQILIAQDLSTMGGASIDFCEIVGQEKNDIKGAELASKFINFQQRHEIPTTPLLTDQALDARIFGIGWSFQDWDFGLNGRKTFVPSPFEVWPDSGPTIQDCKVLVLRREVSIGELYQLRKEGKIWFEEEELDAVLADPKTETLTESSMSGNSRHGASARRKEFERDEHVNPMYRRVYLDIQMDTEPWRWVYKICESLVVAVQPPNIPMLPEYDIRPRFPCSVFAPIRRQRSIFGEPTVSRMRNPQDFSNAIASLMMENVKSSTLGTWTSDDPDLVGTDVKIGEVLGHSQGSSLEQHVSQLNANQLVHIVDWVSSRNADRASGVTDTLRGQQQFSGQTATAVRDMLQQSTARISPQMAQARDCMQEYYEVAITLNRLYLAPHKYFAVIGEQYAQPGVGTDPQSRQITAADLIGVSGKDLVPTGFPGSMTAMTQEALNEAAVINQVGGNPQPLLKAYIEKKYQGRVNADEVFPANGVGNDPMQENEQLFMGAPLSLDPDDNHQTHIVTHMQLTLDPRFSAAVQQSPALQMVWQAHIQAHQQELMKLTGMMAGGMPGGMGIGTSGQGTTLSATPQAKKDAERENQVEQQRSAS